MRRHETLGIVFATENMPDGSITVYFAADKQVFSATQVKARFEVVGDKDRILHRPFSNALHALYARLQVQYASWPDTMSLKDVALMFMVQCLDEIYGSNRPQREYSHMTYDFAYTFATSLWGKRRPAKYNNPQSGADFYWLEATAAAWRELKNQHMEQ